MLIVKSGASAGVNDPENCEKNNRMDNENNLRLNRELFSLELANLTDLSRFLDWEVSHLQTISDLASQLRRLISVQDFIPAVEVRGQLEQLLTSE